MSKFFLTKLMSAYGNDGNCSDANVTNELESTPNVNERKLRRRVYRDNVHANFLMTATGKAKEQAEDKSDSDARCRGRESASLSGRKRRAQPFVAAMSSNAEDMTGEEKSNAEDVEEVADIEAETLWEPQMDELANQERCKRRKPRLPETLVDVGDYRDSVPHMTFRIEELMDYVAALPTLHSGNASFVRDYLRTMLAVTSDASQRERERRLQEGERCMYPLSKLPREVLYEVFSCLNGSNLENVRSVCREWNLLASDERLWKRQCLKEWASLDVDESVWRLINKDIDINDEHKWAKMWQIVSRRPKWHCRLQKTERFICNMVAHQVGGDTLEEYGMPAILIVERRFNVAHLPNFVLPNASVVYFEPETEADRPGFEQFIDYLVKRTRAGLAVDEDSRRFIFVPPCEYSEELNYNGPSLLGIVQIAHPQLQPSI